MRTQFTIFLAAGGNSPYLSCICKSTDRFKKLNMDALQFLRPISVKGKSRLGPEMDGGYVVYNRILKDTTALVTYGVGWEIGFEQHFSEQTGSKVLMFDPTMFGKYILDLKFLKELLTRFHIRSSFEYLRNTWEVWHNLRHLRKQNIFFINEGLSFKKRAKFDTFNNHLERYNLSGEQILLKIDIEGDEFEIFEDPGTYQHLSNVNQLIIEFHDLRNQFSRFKYVIENLKIAYDIIHIHGNNWGGEFCFTDPANGENMTVPNVLEVTFVKRGKVIPADIVNENVPFPIEGLDYPNNPECSDLLLRFI